jgi:hypothetical protein
MRKANEPLRQKQVVNEPLTGKFINTGRTIVIELTRSISRTSLQIAPLKTLRRQSRLSKRMHAQDFFSLAVELTGSESIANSYRDFQGLNAQPLVGVED